MLQDYVWKIEITVEKDGYSFIEEVCLFTTRQAAREYKKNFVSNVKSEDGWNTIAKNCKIRKHKFSNFDGYIKVCKL